jgi:hypothetical protein
MYAIHIHEIFLFNILTGNPANTNEKTTRINRFYDSSLVFLFWVFTPFLPDFPVFFSS